jgi:hypothetical protein
MNCYQTDVLRERLEYASCVGKKAYFSQREADDKAALSSAASGENLIGYECPFCTLWHMGHRKSKRRQESERKLKQYEFASGKRRANEMKVESPKPGSKKGKLMRTRRPRSIPQMRTTAHHEAGHWVTYEAIQPGSAMEVEIFELPTEHGLVGRCTLDPYVDFGEEDICGVLAGYAAAGVLRGRPFPLTEMFLDAFGSVNDGVDSDYVKVSHFISKQLFDAPYRQVEWNRKNDSLYTEYFKRAYKRTLNEYVLPNWKKIEAIVGVLVVERYLERREVVRICTAATDTDVAA